MKFRLLATFRELVSRPWWNDRLDDLRDKRSWSFGFSTLLHVALIVSIGYVWVLNEHVSGVAPLDTRWTDITDTPVPDDSVEKAWAQPQAAATSGGSQAGSSAVFAPARSPRPVEPISILAGTLPPSWFEDGVSNDELGTELSDLDGWRNRLARIGTGQGQGNGNGNGYGGAFFGMKADGQSVVFVVDSSASMNVHHATAATRFQRLKLELLNSVAGMKPSQSFFIIFFNDEPNPMP
ncbi:MAG: hypothetical protein QF363_06395 [Planctomycetaceae bacterium]|nr:hypothetical protein [Planctomycetaceae bacterium]